MVDNLLVASDSIHTVFISSTFEDLREERAEVQKAVLKLGCLPIGMELFPSADDDAWGFIKGEIERSDYYILIVGGRYGSTDTDGISFTEKEYRYAKELNKPRCVFVRDHTYPVGKDKLEQDEDKRRHLNRFISELDVSRLALRFGSPDQLGGQAYFSLDKLRQQRPSPGYVRGGTATTQSDVLANLHTFYGYEEDVRDSETFQNFKIERQPNFSNPNPVSHFWADSYYGSWISARVVKSSTPHLFIDFENAQGSWPSAIAIRPIQQLAVSTRNRPWLLFDAQVATSSVLPKVSLGLRIANGSYQHWVYGTVPGIHTCMLVTKQSQTFAIDLKSHWWLFTSDGNHKYGPKGFDPSIIGSVMFELGGPGDDRGPGSGRGSIRLRNIRFSNTDKGVVRP